MLQGIIKDEFRNNYYLFTSGNSFNIVLSNKSITKHLSKEEATNLLLNVFSNNMIYYGEEDGYQVYRDELNNKRFFKDGYEDYFKLFSYNGKNAILYSEEENNDIEDDSKEIRTKNFANQIFRVIMSGTAIWCTIGLLAYTAITNAQPKGQFNNIDEIERKAAYNFDYQYDKEYEYQYKIIEEKPLTPVEMLSYIDTNNEITEIDKRVLSNPKLFEDILSVADETRDFELRYKLKNLRIKSIEPVVKKASKTEGFYTVLKPGLINVTNKNETNLIDEENRDIRVLAHEYIHLLQNNNGLDVLMEGTDNILVEEYFGFKCYSYPQEIKRMKILMEIIGSEEVFDANFNSITSLKEEVNSLLSDEDTLLFFNTLREDPPLLSDKLDTLDNLLAKMYIEKYNDDIVNNQVIQLIYEGEDGILNKKYFNKDYNSKYIEDILEFEEKYGLHCYHEEENLISVSKEEYDNYQGDKKDNISYSLKEGYEEDSTTHRIVEKGRTMDENYQGYSVSDAWDLGLYIPKTSYFIIEKELVKQGPILSLIANYELTAKTMDEYRIYTYDDTNKPVEVKMSVNEDGKILFEKPESFTNTNQDTSTIKK